MTLFARCAAPGTALLAAAAALLAAQPVRGSQGRSGEAIYLRRCASCHGARGEGTRKHRKPLLGDQSVGQLARFIARAMPPGPGPKCPAEEARLVAAYLHDAFYSPLARERDRPARIELARLTVRQFRQAVTDLIAGFRPAPRPDERQGLHGAYFRSRRFRPDDRLLERVDPEIRFDFGRSAPAEAFDARQFSIRWEGALLAPDTGEYDFIVRTEHGARLWINDRRQPLIDAWVRSGPGAEQRASLFLLGGRTYPLRLEFSKANQGVDDSEQIRNRPVAPAALALEWRPPNRAAEVIPQRCLVPSPCPETFVVPTPFPPDDRSVGYERGTSISKAWDEAVTEAALETAAYVATHLAELAGAGSAGADETERVREFCRQFAARAFRRPLPAELAQRYVDGQFQEAPDLDTAVRRVVLLALKSPRFLYREPDPAAPDAYDVASRLSFGLWDSLPDGELLRAAAAGELSTRAQVAGQAERMLQDPRARSKVRAFFLQWLRVDHFPDLTKDTARFPGFDRQIASDLRTSLELFIDHVVWSERSDYRDLLLSEEVFLNGRLAGYYGANLPPDAPFQRVVLDPTERAGVLTHPYLMASFAYLDATSPIHRGVTIARSLLGRTLRPPPEAVAPVPPQLHPDLTTRQRVALQTRPGACMTCHTMINPLGFTLEKFDAVGRFRLRENGVPVDATGGYETGAGKRLRFSGARSLARFLAVSEEAHSAFVVQLFEHLVKQPPRAFGPRMHADLERAFAANGCSIRRQLVETMTLTVPAG